MAIVVLTRQSVAVFAIAGMFFVSLIGNLYYNINRSASAKRSSRCVSKGA